MAHGYGTTKRLILRDYLPTDFDAVHEYSSDPVNVAHMVYGPNTPEQTRVYLEQTCPAQRAEDPRMHWDQRENDRIFGVATPTLEQIGRLYEALRTRGKTLRVNVNVWKGNLDSVEELLHMVRTLSGSCDAVKLTPLMRTELFQTVPEVTACASELALDEAEIRRLFDSLAARCRVLRRNRSVLGFVEYAELELDGQTVLLKYAQVEDKYDRSRQIPTLKLYPNGCLSNEWSCTKDVRCAAERKSNEQRRGQ